MTKYMLKDRELHRAIDRWTRGRFSKDLHTYSGGIFCCALNFTPEDIDQVEEDTNSWNRFPEVTPPTGVLMIVKREGLFTLCLHETAFFNGKVWLKEQDGPVPQFARSTKDLCLTSTTRQNTFLKPSCLIPMTNESSFTPPRSRPMLRQPKVLLRQDGFLRALRRCARRKLRLVRRAHVGGTSRSADGCDQPAIRKRKFRAGRFRPSPSQVLRRTLIHAPILRRAT